MIPAGTIARGDAVEVVRRHVDDASVDAVVTSPPYFGRRTYGDSEDELGRGEHLKTYVDRLVELGRELRRALKPDGVLWLNIGDTAAGSGGAGGDHNRGGSKAWVPKYRQGPTGLERRQWIGVPWRVALALQEDGWLLRSAVTWDKVNRRPEDLRHARRPGESSEAIFLFAAGWPHRFYPERLEEPGDVWHFKARRRADAPRHFAPYPEELALRCILPSTEPGELVLDPFAGSGTTLHVAEELGRRAIGVDLYAGEALTPPARRSDE